METNNAPAIHLQGIGLVTAKPAAELVVGDKTVWNYGYVEVVRDVIPVSPRFVKVTLTPIDDPTHVFFRRMKRERLVGITTR